MAQNETDEVKIGLDFGTSKTCVALWQNGNANVVSDAHGNRTIRSCVAFVGMEILVGSEAWLQKEVNRKNTIFDIKRLLGRTLTDPLLRADVKRWPFSVLGDPSEKPLIEAIVHGEPNQFTAEDISSMLLKRIKEFSETSLGKGVMNMVVAVPAYFNDAQRHAMKKSCTMAGLHVLMLIEDPIAAIYAYGLHKAATMQNILVFDFGGRNLEISVVAIDGGRSEIKATCYNMQRGGVDFDHRLLDHFVSEIKKVHRKDIRLNEEAIVCLLNACEQAKCDLSSRTQAFVEVDNIFEGNAFTSSITRSRFENLCIDYFESAVGLIQNVLLDAGIGKEEVHGIILSGGSTRIPRLQRMLCELFNGKPLYGSIDPVEVVALGAAMMAGKLSTDTE